jgi:hypothetical protein
MAALTASVTACPLRQPSVCCLTGLALDKVGGFIVEKPICRGGGRITRTLLSETHAGAQTSRSQFIMVISCFARVMVGLEWSARPALKPVRRSRGRFSEKMVWWEFFGKSSRG